MTLSEILPTLGCSLDTRLEPHLWPRNVSRGPDGDLTFAGIPLATLAAGFGTPAFLLDEHDVRTRCREYRDALPGAEIAFATKSLAVRGVLRWMHEEGMSIDTCSSGELAVARAVGFPADRILLHGNAKTAEDLKAAISYGPVRIVLDSLDEIDALGTLGRHEQPVLLRVNPDIDAHTHPSISTGTAGGKFGFALPGAPGESLADAVRALRAHPNLRLAGLHCHLGSQIRRVRGYEQAVRRMVEVIARLHHEHGLAVPQLDLGGGHAIPYVAGDSGFDLRGFADRVRGALHYECSVHDVPVPRLVFEPGRAIVGPAGITLYRVVNVKPGARGVRIVAVDGGMSDNPRPALYGARYTARLVGRHSTAARGQAVVVGRHCESGDVLAETDLPEDVHAGDLLAVPCTGAYHHALASNYNLVSRPPLIGVADGAARMLVRRETEDDLLRRT